MIYNLDFPLQPEIVSTPNFVVDVTKQASKHSLVFDCHFPEDEVGTGRIDSSSSSISLTVQVFC